MTRRSIFSGSRCRSCLRVERDPEPLAQTKKPKSCAESLPISVFFLASSLAGKDPSRIENGTDEGSEDEVIESGSQKTLALEAPKRLRGLQKNLGRLEAFGTGSSNTSESGSQLI